MGGCRTKQMEGTTHNTIFFSQVAVNRIPHKHCLNSAEFLATIKNDDDRKINCANLLIYDQIN